MLQNSPVGSLTCYAEQCCTVADRWLARNDCARGVLSSTSVDRPAVRDRGDRPASAWRGVAGRIARDRRTRSGPRAWDGAGSAGGQPVGVCAKQACARVVGDGEARPVRAGSAGIGALPGSADRRGSAGPGARHDGGGRAGGRPRRRGRRIFGRTHVQGVAAVAACG